MIKFIKQLSVLLLISTFVAVSGCSTIGELTGQTPKLIGRQPQHLIFTKSELFLEGPVKSVTYASSRSDFTGDSQGKEVIIDFNLNGQVTKVEGNEKLLRQFGFIRYLDLPKNTLIGYGKQNELLTYESAKKMPRYEYKGGVEDIHEETGNVKSFWLKHIKNKDTSAEKRYNTLDYFIYGENQYMQITRDNRKRENNIASIYKFDEQNRLTDILEHEESYSLDNPPSKVMESPKKYLFKVKKRIIYDHKGRISQVRQVKRKGQLTSVDLWSYKIRTDLPRRMSSVDGEGTQQFRIEFSDYEIDKYENWVKRKVSMTVRRGDRDGIDERRITYFTPEELEKISDQTQKTGAEEENVDKVDEKPEPVKQEKEDKPKFKPGPTG